MATGDDMAELCKKFEELAASTGKDKTKFQSTASQKLLTDYMGSYKQLTANDVDIGVNTKMYLEEKKAAGKAVKYWTINDTNCKQFMKLCAFEYAKKKSKPAPKNADDPAVTEYKDKMITTILEKKVEKKEEKKSAVVDRLTDASGYTGAHKERFTKDGKGKGIEGRVDKADNSGYVGNYKNKNTFDAKKK